MVRSAQHVLNNFLNKMSFFLLLAEEPPGFPAEGLTVIHGCSAEAQVLIDMLGSLDRVDEQRILESLAPQ